MAEQRAGGAVTLRVGMHNCSLRIELPAPFDLRLALFGHGWVDLHPNRWDESRQLLHTVVPMGQSAADLILRQQQTKLFVSVTTAHRLSAARKQNLTQTVEKMLRLDEDFAEFYGLCRRRPAFGWVARRGAGRLLRAATWFEDLAKVLLTTNCSWSQTRAMVERLCVAYGRSAPSSTRSFPSAPAIAAVSEDHLRREMRVGYRARALRELAEQLAVRGAHQRWERLRQTPEALREQLARLRGFGPYAVGQALRLAGNYQDFALDSWCQNTFEQRGYSCSKQALSRRYGGFKQFKGLALWVDLTAPWHGEGPFSSAEPSPLEASHP